MMARLTAYRLYLLLFLIVSCSSTNADNSESDQTDNIQPIYESEYIIAGLSIINLNTGGILNNQNIHIRSGVIIDVGMDIESQDSIPIYDMQGKFVIPSLTNMHSHTQLENDFFLNLANGVTWVRHMWGNTHVLDLKNKFADSLHLGPRLTVASAGFEQPPSNWPGTNLVTSKDQIESQIAEQVRVGYDYIKVYENLTSENYYELHRAASKHNIPLIGHIPYSISLKEVLQENYQSTIEHVDSYFESILRGGSNINIPATYAFNEQKLQEIVILTTNSEVWNSPTITITTRNKTQESDLEKNPYMKYVSPQMKSWFRGPGSGLTLWDSDSYSVHKLRLVKKLFDSGSKLLLGVDTGLRYLIPGLTVHEELENFVKAGIPELDALKIATINGIKYLGLEDKYGSVEIGKRADFVLLDQNPLEDIRNTRSISAVVREEYILTKEYLDSRLAQIASEYK